MQAQSPRDKLVDAILRRAASDFEFRGSLLRDPKSAIYNAFGIRVPDGYTVKFVEREPGVDALIVLPDSTNESAPADGELTDVDLDAISGGVSQHYMWAMDFKPGGSGGDVERRSGTRSRSDTRGRSASE